MLKRFVPFITCTVLLLVGRSARAQTTPQEVSFCNLANDPKSFDGKLIRVRGTMSVYFEDFSLFSEDCHTQQGIWLTFGGDVPATIVSTVNDNFRNPGMDIKVNGVPYEIKKDEDFRRFYALIAARHGDNPAYRVTATLTGAFFAGEQRKLLSGESVFAGYGHLGCCSLLVITQVSEVESVPPANLNVSGTAIGPDGKPLRGFTVVNEPAAGAPPLRQQTSTDESGGFSFSDSGSVLRFEDPRYRPIALAVEPGGAPVRVTLEEAKRTDWVVPSCEQVGGSAGRVGFSALFTLSAGFESNPIDNGDSQSYFIFPRGTDPVESIVMSISTLKDQTTEETNAPVYSKWSEQRWIKDSAGTVIGLDSRGQYGDKQYWRTATFLGHDSASYTLQSHKVARSMDQIIDSACIAKP